MKLVSWVLSDEEVSNLEKRFFEKVKRVGVCWLWTAYVDKDGYGKFHTMFGQWAHRFAFEWFHKTKIKSGMHIHHKCKNPSCVNPDHLEQVSAEENMSILRRRVILDYCFNGHKYEDVGFRMIQKKNGHPFRQCKQCCKEAQARLRKKKRMNASNNAQIPT